MPAAEKPESGVSQRVENPSVKVEKFSTRKLQGRVKGLRRRQPQLGVTMRNHHTDSNEILRAIASTVDESSWNLSAFTGPWSGRVFTVTLPRDGRSEALSLDDAVILAEELYDQAVAEGDPHGTISISIQADDGTWVHFGSDEQLRIAPAPVFATERTSDWLLN